MYRTEKWTLDGRTAVVDVEKGREVVEVSYELIAEMLTALGYIKAD